MAKTGLSAFQQFVEVSFVDDCDAQGFCFCSLGAATFASEKVVCFGGDGSGDFATLAFDQFFELRSGCGEGSSEDEGFSDEGEFVRCFGLGFRREVIGDRVDLQITQSS